LNPVFNDSVELLPERFNEGKKTVNVKITKIWKKYQHLWDPISFAACKLNPSININLKMEMSQTDKGDRYILSTMKNPAPIEVMEKPTKKTNPLCCFSNNVIESNETASEISKKIQMCEMIDLLKFWKSQSKGELSQISEVAIKI